MDVESGIDNTSNLESPQVNELDRFVTEGLSHIKEGRFEEAMRYFRDREFIDHIGFRFSAGRSVSLDRTPSAEDSQEIADSIALWSYFDHIFRSCE
jgi:hypothetical protein